VWLEVHKKAGVKMRQLFVFISDFSYHGHLKAINAIAFAV